MWCAAEKVSTGNYYSIYLYKGSNEFNTIGAHDKNINSVITKNLAKKIIDDNDIDTEEKKYLATVFGKVKKNVYWFSKYTLVIDKIELKAWDRTIMKVIE